MARDEKTRKKTPEYEPPEKQQSLARLGMTDDKTNDIEHKHSLGVFVEMKRSYSGVKRFSPKRPCNRELYDSLQNEE